MMDLMQRRRVPYVTIGIILVNVLYFLFLELTGSTQDLQFMIRQGAMYAPDVMEKGEYYRLLTSTFLHFGIDHIANNMLILFVMGNYLEKAMGRMRYALLYLLSGTGANLFSMFVNRAGYETRISAGASGAVFGIVGGLLFVVIRNRGHLDDLSTRQMIIMTILSLYLSSADRGVDNAAHVGGVLIGFVLAMILYRRKKNDENRMEECI